MQPSIPIELLVRLTDSSKWKSPQTAHASLSGSLTVFFFFFLIHFMSVTLAYLVFLSHFFFFFFFMSSKFATACVWKALILAPRLFDSLTCVSFFLLSLEEVNVSLHLLIILSFDPLYLSCTVLRHSSERQSAGSSALLPTYLPSSLSAFLIFLSLVLWISLLPYLFWSVYLFPHLLFCLCLLLLFFLFTLVSSWQLREKNIL